MCLYLELWFPPRQGPHFQRINENRWFVWQKDVEREISASLTYIDWFIYIYYVRSWTWWAYRSLSLSVCVVYILNIYYTIFYAFYSQFLFFLLHLYISKIKWILVISYIQPYQDTIIYILIKEVKYYIPVFFPYKTYVTLHRKNKHIYTYRNTNIYIYIYI